MSSNGHISTFIPTDLDIELDAPLENGTGTDSEYLINLKVLTDEYVEGLENKDWIKSGYKRDALCARAKRALRKAGHPTLEELNYCFPQYDHTDYIKQYEAKEKERLGISVEAEVPKREKHRFEQLHFAAVTPQALEIFLKYGLPASDWAVYVFLATHLTLETGLTNFYSRNDLADEIPELHRTSIWRSLNRLEEAKLIIPQGEPKNNDTSIRWEVVYVDKQYALYKKERGKNGANRKY